MNFLRNPELRRELLWAGAAALLFSVLGFLLSPACCLLVLAASGVSLLLSLLAARRRYQNLERLSERIDRVLHGQERLLIWDANEGELAILSNEIEKMTLRLREQSDQLLAEQRHLTEAIQDMFHQIRTPLTSMNLVVSLLEGEELAFPRRVELTRELKRQLDRIQWLVETLLKLSKIDAGAARFRKEPVAVRELVLRAMEPLRIPMELRGQTLKLSAEAEQFTGDAAWTLEAVGNLLKNCVEHTPPGGTIWVTAVETALYTQILVEDNGPGFRQKDLPHLFERFYRGEGASRESVGIGLALAQSIVVSQNGTIAAANAPAGGARFTVRFYKSVV